MKIKDLPETQVPVFMLPPNAPTHLTAIGHYGYLNWGISLAWREKIDSAQDLIEGLDYRVYRAVGGGAFKVIGTTDQRSYHDKSVKLNTEYRYHVTAINRHGESKPSNEATAEVVRPIVIHGPLGAGARIGGG